MSGMPQMVVLSGSTVPMLQVRDVCALGNRMHDEGRARLILAFAEAGVSDSEKAKALAEYDRDRGNVISLLKWARSLHGAIAIIETACAKAGLDAAAVLSALDPVDLVDTASNLLFRPTNGRAEGKAGGGTGDGSGSG